MPSTRQRAGPLRKRWSLYWVTTEDASEDCFVVAHSARSAAGFFEGHEGYDSGDADVEHVADLPEELQSATGWREAPSTNVTKGAAYAPDALILACGGEIAHQRTDQLREFFGEMVKDFRFGDRHFRPRCSKARGGIV